MLAHILAVACAFAADRPEAGAMIVPGACYKLSLSENAQTIDRIELQFMQVIAKDRRPIGGARIQLGIQPRRVDDVMPSGLSAPCSGAGHSLSCTLSCSDTGKHSRLGRFRTEPVGPGRIRLVIETPLVLNGCPPETPSAAPVALAGKAFVLWLAETNNCFH